MPRRRKSLHKKAPLIFTESPINKQRNAPTPVYCAQHPLTVPLQDCSRVSWVSPQFKGVPGTVNGQRRARRRRVSPPGLLQDKPVCTCHCKQSPARAKRSKFPSLKFVGERAPPVTIMQDVEITDDEEDIEKENYLSNGQENSYREFTRFKYKLNFSDLEEPGQHSHVSTPQMTETQQTTHNSETKPRAHNSDSPPVKRLFSSESSETTWTTNKRTIKSGRLKKNLMMNLDVSTVHSPETRIWKGKILVADTPESEYGLNTRIRRLRTRKVLVN